MRSPHPRSVVPHPRLAVLAAWCVGVLVVALLPAHAEAKPARRTKVNASWSASGCRSQTSIVMLMRRATR